jgi:hypothetical protein
VITVARPGGEARCPRLVSVEFRPGAPAAGLSPPLWPVARSRGFDALGDSAEYAPESTTVTIGDDETIAVDTQDSKERF